VASSLRYYCIVENSFNPIRSTPRHSQILFCGFNPNSWIFLIVGYTDFEGCFCLTDVGNNL
jgi:hypothetical protein